MTVLWIKPEEGEMAELESGDPKFEALCRQVAQEMERVHVPGAVMGVLFEGVERIPGVWGDQRGQPSAGQCHDAVSDRLYYQDVCRHAHYASGGAGHGGLGCAVADLSARAAPPGRVGGGAGDAAPSADPHGRLGRRLFRRLRPRRGCPGDNRREDGGSAAVDAAR